MSSLNDQRYQDDSFETIQDIPLHKMPKHIGIILDGNNRWARTHHYDDLGRGHLAGREAVRHLLQYFSNYPIKTLSLFIFSSENWKRPEKEVKYLLKLLVSTIKKEIKNLHQKGIRLKFIGDIQAFNPSLRTMMIDYENMTAHNNQYTLILAINYGGRWDILEAAKKVIKKVQNNQLAIEDINLDCFESHLATGDLPEPDLLIRTSGENRLSNFMLWQCAYTELYFTNTLWPDFTEENFQQALMNYASRHRRFGQKASLD